MNNRHLACWTDIGSALEPVVVGAPVESTQSLSATRGSASVSCDNTRTAAHRHLLRGAAP